MTSKYNHVPEILEQIRARKYQEVTERQIELEQKRLDDIFPTLSDLAVNIEAGNRMSMLELMSIAIDSLRLFETLSRQNRELLASSLEKMQSNLQEAKDFLPRGRGERSIRESKKQAIDSFLAAQSVELRRKLNKLSLEDAIAEEAESSGLTESLIQKRWKRSHKDAKRALELMDAALEQLGLSSKSNRQ